MNTTKRIEKTIEALEKKQLKNALFLTDREETQRHHQWVEEAARVCLTNKGDKERCDTAIKEAKAKIQETVTLPLEDTSLEGIEEMLEQKPVEKEEESQKSDEELYENCPECHVADAVLKFHEIGETCGSADVVSDIKRQLGDEETAPEIWLKKMIEITENASCGKEKYQFVLTQLTNYLEKRESPILRALDTPETK